MLKMTQKYSDLRCIICFSKNRLQTNATAFRILICPISQGSLLSTQSSAVSRARLCSIYTRLSHMQRKALAYLMFALPHPSQRSPNGSQFASIVVNSHCRTHTDQVSFRYNYPVLGRVAYQGVCCANFVYFSGKR